MHLEPVMGLIFNCNLNLKYIIAFTIRNMRAGLCFDLKYFRLTLPHTSLKATLVYNDTFYLVPLVMA